ncbi:hypothetical protein ACFSJS_03120 [Streptomyces desertarenae]|uniref:Uncharacterized protein n=1 Tax=Streptomyces desertarenae TaxID=2666184 RepID=A0ABW4PD98_9ACTN
MPTGHLPGVVRATEWRFKSPFAVRPTMRGGLTTRYRIHEGGAPPTAGRRGSPAGTTSTRLASERG